MQGKPIKLILLSGSQGNEVGRDRRLGVFKGLIEGQLVNEGKASFVVLGQGWGSWAQEEGLKAAEDQLQAHPDANVVLGENNSMVLGAMKALEAANKKEVLVLAAADGQKEALALIKEGKYGANRFGFVRQALERKLVADLAGSLKLKASRIDAPVSTLSGGNQQKVVLAKWFHAGGNVIILDEPTRGVDVGAKSEIYGIVLKLAEAGKAVLVISSEHQELFGLCDRILVMGEGQLRGELKPPDYTEERLLSLAISGSTLHQKAA